MPATRWPSRSESTDRRHSRVLALVFMAALLVLGVACSATTSAAAPKLDSPAETGQQLIETYMALLARKDVAGLENLLSDSFMRQGADGQFATKAEYLANLPQISTYKITDVTANQSGDALVVRWLFTVNEVVSGKTLQTSAAPRLATFVWEGGQWRLLSHANFNPVAG